MPEYICEVQEKMILNNNDADRIWEIMNSGGLCIAPSDSSYILTGLLTVQGVTDDLDILLEREGMPMSLAFESLKQINQYIKLSHMACDFIRKFTPGGLTFVAKPKYEDFIKISIKRLHADGTVGVRLSESKVETRLAQKYPIPTTPIRNDLLEEVSAVEEALKIVENRMRKYGIHRDIALIKGVVPYPNRLSTVVKEEKREGLWHLVVLRENAVPVSKIKEVAEKCHYAGIIY